MARNRDTAMEKVKNSKNFKPQSCHVVCKSTNPIIDINGRLWPCCFMAVGHRNSQYINQQGKGWNDTNKHSVKEILDHEAFTEHFNDKGWSSDTPDEMCVRECGVNSDKLADKRLNVEDND